MPKSFNLAEVLDVAKLPEYLDRVETRMQEVLSKEDTQMGDAVMRITKARGKRLRPSLVITCALLSDIDVSDVVINTAAAVELIHIGSLVHDDIIDKASIRWDIPTINTKEGLEIAILSGDFLFAKACSMAGYAGQQAGILAAETITQLCSGESAELATQYNIHRTEEQLEQAIYGKTAVLMAASCRLGGLCANLPDNKLEAMWNFGRNFGMAFQLIDDVLDFVSTDTLLGKPVGNDIKEGIYTLPIVLSLQGSKRKQIDKVLAKKASSLTLLTELLIEDASINITLAKARGYNKSAEQALVTAFGKRAHKLAQLPSNYLEWALSNLVAPQYRAKIAS